MSNTDKVVIVTRWLMKCQAQNITYNRDDKVLIAKRPATALLID